MLKTLERMTRKPPRPDSIFEQMPLETIHTSLNYQAEALSLLFTKFSAIVELFYAIQNVGRWWT